MDKFIPRSVSTGSNINVPNPSRFRIAEKIADKSIEIRRSANYQPSKWSFDYVESLSSIYGDEKYNSKLENLKGEVKAMIEKEHDHLKKLEIIDALQRLGVAYHFEDEIESFLRSIYEENALENNNISDDVYATALQFRLLRQQGYKVPQEVFNSSKDENGDFKESLCEDVKGLLQMYEASFLSIGGESVLDELREFSLKNLRLYAKNTRINGDDYVFKLVNHALELPLHWKMQRSEAIWYIKAYETNPFHSPLLLQFAKLDFNILQAVYQEELKNANLWRKNIGLVKKLDFSRDRLMEEMFGAVGAVFEPEFGYVRKIIARVSHLIPVIDDIYDVYSTLDEAQLFTDAVERWDVDAMDELPEYMKICFLCLHNAINEFGYDCLKDHGLHIIPYLKKSWGKLCKAYLLEAKWYHSGYTPSLEEYLENGWISVTGPMFLVHAYFAATNQITNEASQSLNGSYPDRVKLSSLIVRLADDLETYPREMERGDNPKSIQCYMNETGESEEAAQDHIHELIREAWEKMNRIQMEKGTKFSKTFKKLVMNFARMGQFMYQYGDGFGAPGRVMEDHAISLFMKPLQL